MSSLELQERLKAQEHHPQDFTDLQSCLSAPNQWSRDGPTPTAFLWQPPQGQPAATKQILLLFNILSRPRLSYTARWKPK